ncbi:hypothetical protein M422DRAFT_64832 [Sphaerobolus stellatus SS14]|nr:hypothetical protein M422DRAFT_64832 [Sphaerobolus stellatus SS14]
MIRLLTLVDHKGRYIEDREYLPKAFKDSPIHTFTPSFSSALASTPSAVLDSLPLAIEAMSALTDFSWHDSAISKDMAKCVYPALKHTLVPLRSLQTYAFDTEDGANIPISLLGFYSATTTRLFVTVLFSAPETCIVPIVDSIIANYPSLVDLYIKTQSFIGIPNLLLEGHWHYLKRISIESYGSLFVGGTPVERATIMTDFFRRHSHLEAFWTENTADFYPGFLPEEGHPSLKALELGLRYQRDAVCDFHLFVPSSIISRVSFLGVTFKFLNPEDLHRVSQAQNLTVCRLTVSIKDYSVLLSVIPPTLERLDLTYYFDPIGFDACDRIVACHVQEGHFDKFQNLVLIGGVLSRLEKDDPMAQGILNNLVKLPKLTFVQVQPSKFPWIKIIRGEDNQSCLYEDVTSGTIIPMRWGPGFLPLRNW